MSIRESWVLPLLLGACLARGAEPATGFQEEKRVRQATRLDWGFVVGRTAKLPHAYDPRKVRYQLYVPPTYKAERAWPLVVFVSPGDAPLGWPAFEKACEKHEMLFCVAHGAGNDCNATQRVRLLCDMIDDVRRDYRIDPDRTIVAGLGTSAASAFRLATALPESFGGVLLIGGDAPLPDLDYLRFRLQDRLSVALVGGGKVPGRSYRQALLAGLGVRVRSWAVDCEEGELPPGESLVEPIFWLDGDVKRRRADTKEYGGEDKAEAALKRVERDGRIRERLLRSAATLEWVAKRFGESETGRESAKSLLAMTEGPETKNLLIEAKKGEVQRRLLAEAKAATKSEKWTAARQAWKSLAEALPDADARDEARAEWVRIDGILAGKPYLGMAFEGATVTLRSVVPNGPAFRAGLRAGDRIEKRDGNPTTTSAALSKALATGKPGQIWTLEVTRGRETVEVRLTLGSRPAD